MKPEKVNVTDKQDDSGSDSSWFVRDAGESIEEGDAEWVSGDGIEDEDIGEEEAEKASNSEKVWSSEPDKDKRVKDLRVHFVKGDGFEDASEDTTETDEEEMVKQDEAPISWEDGKEEETSAPDSTNAPGSKTEVREGELEAKSDNDKFVKDLR